MQTPVPVEKSALTRSEKRRVGLCASAGFFFAPGAWLLQVMVSETISAQACSAGSIPRVTPVFPNLDGWLYGTSIAAFAVAAICAALAVYGYVLLGRKQKQVKEERSDVASSAELSRAEEEVSRKRFVALCSALIGCGFVLGLMFTVLAEVFFQSCSQWH
ncbi:MULTISPECIES: hypothetical protein [Caballeronia]|uniref:Cytochrome C oxidase subunit I n=1 Tax=Caballeronia zhejiangensis TaxID=871203 RepID=A0A656QF54_9BURK|nr:MULTISPECIES: hypothetical protein [Caballeronia]EKS71972.1 hypothetical protein BURK_009076 [Burkholderia sp. SJ98]KDR26294.1 hypothetical protein BG60_23715 [Caballeronia zhejiangensis]